MQIHSNPKKERFIRLRVNDEEYFAFFEKAKKQGYTTVSDFIRSLIRGNSSDSRNDKIKKST